MNIPGEQPKNAIFSWVDYSVFSSLIGLSLLIGFYSGIFKKQNSASEYLFGGKTMHYIPVGVSILASHLSGIMFLGIPSETYEFGSQLAAGVIAAACIGLFTAHLTMPMFYNLQVNSSCEYLELRFSKKIRVLASGLYIISLFLYIPIIVYVPALAFSQLTGYDIHMMTAIFSIVCITYTTFGGVKAVVLTDTVQFMFTLTGLFTILTIGIVKIGGIGQVLKITNQRGRLILFNMDPSLLKKDTFWANTVGLFCSIIGRCSVGQKFVQRYIAIGNQNYMKRSVAIMTVGWMFLLICCVLLGLTAYTQYHDCDPVKAKFIEKNDQILPYYVMDIVGDIPGLPGIFLAGIVSSSLATLSASLNTLAGIIYEDFIAQWLSVSNRNQSEVDARAANIMKVICAIVGIINIGLIYTLQYLGSILQMTLTMSSIAEGPMFGLFVIGMACPWIGKKSAMIGTWVSVGFMICFVAGTYWNSYRYHVGFPAPPTSIENCTGLMLNVSLPTTLDFNSTIIDSSANPPDQGFTLLRIVYFYFGFIAILVTIFISTITSFILKEDDLKEINPDHFIPSVRRFLPKKKIYSEVPLQETSNSQKK